MSVEGTIETRNDRGIKVNGEWFNLSKFHVIHDLPPVGALIRAEVDNKGFLKSVEQLDERTAAAVSDREERIARLTVLKAAANFAAPRVDIKSADVLTIAERWLAWVEAD